MKRLAHAARPLTAVAALLLLLGDGPSPVSAQGQAARYLAAARGMALLEEGLESSGELGVEAALLLDDPTASGESVQLDVLVDLAQLGPFARFRIAVVVARLDDEPLVIQEAPAGRDLGEAAEWLYRTVLELPEDLLDVAVVVSELETGLWGATVAAFGEEPLEASGSRAVSFAPAEPEAATLGAPDPPTPPAARTQPARTATSRSVIQILPPRNQPVTGKVRFRTFTVDAAVRKVIFYLDGEEAFVDESAPFTATLDLGPEPEPHAVRARAFGLRDLPLGEDSILVNQLGAPFQVRIVAMAGGLDATPLTLDATVTVPPEATLDRVEFYLGERLLDTLRQPPFRIEVPDSGATAQDFVRVAAFLTDGTSLDDARLLADGGLSERVEVNLVELYVVVTDKEGRPRDDLEQGAFTIRHRGQERPIERFGLAEQVPLDLGLVIDTSESMYVLMPDTKKAGVQFLTQVLQQEDEAFLVDFDNEPRLAHPTTGDLGSLLRAFGRLTTKGATAMYDAIIFSMLQFEGGDGRRALVLLTDGDDYRSRFSQRRCIDYAQELGVPVYIIALGGIHNPRAGLPKLDLEGITQVSGGGIEYISAIEDLGPAYERIEHELRSQYLLTFSTDRPLSRQELRGVQVKVAGRGLKVRTVVGARPTDAAPSP